MNIYNTNKRTSRLVSKGFALVSYPLLHISDTIFRVQQYNVSTSTEREDFAKRQPDQVGPVHPHIWYSSCRRSTKMSQHGVRVEVPNCVAKKLRDNEIVDTLSSSKNVPFRTRNYDQRGSKQWVMDRQP